MKPPKEYLDLKKKALKHGPVRGKLTPKLAEYLLSIAGDCRPINHNYAAFVFGFYYISGIDLDYDDDISWISVNFDNDKLVSGVQRLAGFLYSGIKERPIIFINMNPDKAYARIIDIGLPLSPKPIP